MEQIDIEKLLQEGKIVQTKLRGYSMYPLFVPGREDVRIESCRQDSLHRGDVVLYRRTGGRLVLHRIHHIKNGKYYMVVFQTMQTGYRKNCSFFQKPEKEINPILI